MRCRPVLVALLVACLFAVACGEPPTSDREPRSVQAQPIEGPISDTGYIGAWERRETGSVISMVELEAGIGFTWSRVVEGQIYRCTRAGRCDVYIGEQAVFRYDFRTYRTDDSEHLFVECTGTPAGEGGKSVRFVERLELAPGGTELLSYAVELEGLERDPPDGPIRFVKMSNTPL